MNIPDHTKCINCGECCVPVPITHKDEKRIRKFILTLDEDTKSRLRNQKRGVLDCQFLDQQEKRCAIYPVRPVVCRLMGVVSGMECPQGNTAEIDGTKFLPKKQVYLMPNFLKK